MTENKNKPDVFWIVLCSIAAAFIVFLIAFFAIEIKKDADKKEAERFQKQIEYDKQREEEKKLQEKLRNPDYYIIEDPEVPYVGMPERMINDTGLGRYSHLYETSYRSHGVTITVKNYNWFDGDRHLFRATLKNGVVSEVKDDRDKEVYKWSHYEKEREKAGSENSSDSESKKEYPDAASLWEDDPDEFDDIDDAEEYWEDMYGG